MYLFVTFIFTVSRCNIIRARKLDVQKKKKKKKKKKSIEIWFEILVERNHFLVRLKFLLPILLFVTFFYLSRNKYFCMHPKWSGALYCQKSSKPAKYSVKELVNFIFMSPVIFMLLNLFKKLFCFAKL